MKIPIQTIIAHYGEKRDGEFCANCVCNVCRMRWVAIAPWDADLSVLECPSCGVGDCDADIVVCGAE